MGSTALAIKCAMCTINVGTANDPPKDNDLFLSFFYSESNDVFDRRGKQPKIDKIRARMSTATLHNSENMKILSMDSIADHVFVQCSTVNAITSQFISTIFSP